ncbi:hypothetical protein K2173_007237 [Erythroxylum novogranatense]|uniref:SANT domain-containing protein n=1 Tax=Erythroxylum novogranatense TaxID=1862640 RepID=A0AAV8UBY0_9ROSI|nr:hypothetical protein K2173_007237 [Erythroxylum novogranatense]
MRLRLDSNMEDIQDNTEQSLSPTSSDMGDTGDTQVVPRVGDQYQANVPCLITEYDPLKLKNMPGNSIVTFDTHCSFVLGLPIPVMWLKAEIKNINGTVESVNSEESQVISKNECQKFEIQPVAFSLNRGNDLEDSNHQLGAASTKMKVDLIFSEKPESKMNKVDGESCPFPGIASGFWTDLERDSFLLGLFIFGKNLISVKRFVESKGMGDILAFYYGPFYRSDEFRRWSECRKLRTRRNVQGRKIFTGWRQQELLSRLLSHVSQECHHILLQIFRLYGEGKIAFEDYIFALTHAVGINVLVEAIGIGKGKQDLTSVAIEPKSNHVISVRHEIPIGKACSSLTSADIIKFLTGDFRLSKARSSDLFWEAVWPRLLARGWHSEQPKDQAISGSNSKYSLVFLVPGVKKFSRRRLVKGKHYFDSVSDVLNKVASDPELLELQVESAKGDQNKDEYRWDPPSKKNQDCLSNKRHCYLQPRNLNCDRNVQKFTIIDTSLAYGTEQPKVRELRSLPVGGAGASSFSSISSESEQDTSEESEEEAIEMKTQNPAENDIDRKAICDSSDCVNSIRNSSTCDSLDPTTAAAENHEIDSLCLLNDKQPRETMEYQFSWKFKPDPPKYLVPLRKQLSYIGCNIEQSISTNKNVSAETKLNEDESHCTSNSHTYEDIICPAQNSSSATSLAKGSPDRDCEAVVGEDCRGSGVHTEKPQSPKLIDLNVPHVSSDFEDEPIMKEMIQNNDSLHENETCLPSKMNCQADPDLMKLSDAMAAPWHPPVLNSRRQSTRNRPLTTKALEAMELGFFNTKKRKCGNSLANNKMSMSSRRVRGRNASRGTANDDVQNNAEDSGGGEVLDGSYNNTDIVDESLV